jgi:hypothetical protein
MPGFVSHYQLQLQEYMLISITGLDPGRYRNSSGEGEERAFATLDSQMSDHERFKLCDPFMVTCRKCKNTTPYVPMYDREVNRINCKDFCFLLTQKNALRNQSFSPVVLHVHRVRHRSLRPTCRCSLKYRSEHIYHAITQAGSYVMIRRANIVHE